jgi:hypothetical protein
VAAGLLAGLAKWCLVQWRLPFPGVAVLALLTPALFLLTRRPRRAGPRAAAGEARGGPGQKQLGAEATATDSTSGSMAAAAGSPPALGGLLLVPGGRLISAAAEDGMAGPAAAQLTDDGHVEAAEPSSSLADRPVKAAADSRAVGPAGAAAAAADAQQAAAAPGGSLADRLVKAAAGSWAQTGGPPSGVAGSALYQPSKRLVQTVLLSCAVPLLPGQDIAAVAAVAAGSATAAMQQVAAAAGGRLLSSRNVATDGSVHVVVSGSMALPAPTADEEEQAAAQTLQQLLQALQQEAAQELQQQLPAAAANGALSSVEVQLVVYAASGAEAQQARGLVTPLCLVCPSSGGEQRVDGGASDAAQAGASMGSVLVTVEVSSELLEAGGLFQGQQARLLLDCSTAGGSAVGMAECVGATVAAGSFGGSTKQLSMEVEAPHEPGVLLLHLLPAARQPSPQQPSPQQPSPQQPSPQQPSPQQPGQQAAAESPLGPSSGKGAAAPAAGAERPLPVQVPRLVHPLVSLPLLCLPYPAAQESLQLFARMAHQVQEAAEGGAAGAGGAASSVAAAASLEAYTQHYAQYALEWAWLLGPASGAELNPAAQAAAAQQLAALLGFLSAQGMPACLQLAAQALEAKLPQVAEQVIQLLAGEQARRWQCAEEAAPAGEGADGSAAGQAVAAALSAAAGGAAPGGRRPARLSWLVLPVSPDVLLPPILHLTATLQPPLAFPDPTIEARYREERCRKMAAEHDGLVGVAAAALYAAVLLWAATLLPPFSWQLKAVSLALLLGQAPFLLRLAALERYAKHRQFVVEMCVLVPKVLLFAAGSAACCLPAGTASERSCAVMRGALAWMQLVSVVQHSTIRPSIRLAAGQFVTPVTWWLWGSGWTAAAAVGSGLAVALASWMHARWADEWDRRRFAQEMAALAAAAAGA